MDPPQTLYLLLRSDMSLKEEAIKTQPENESPLLAITNSKSGKDYVYLRGKFGGHKIDIPIFMCNANLGFCTNHVEKNGSWQWGQINSPAWPWIIANSWTQN